MSDIKQLIRKYEKPTRAEKYTKKYQNRLNTEKARKHRHLILDELLKEVPFILQPYQIDQIRHWIDTFNKNFKDFHRQASNETIILAFIMIQRKHTNPQTKVYKFQICEKYNLTTPVFELIQNRLVFQLMRTTPLTYTLSKKYDHEILNKNGE